jgi:hypothetical protein
VSIDLRQLRPGKLAGLLNSTRMGEVTSESRVRRNVVRAGWRVGDGRQVNVLAYAAWLMSTWHGQAFPTTSASGPTGYDARKERERLRAADQSKTGRDIGAQLDELPAVERPDLRAACEGDFKLFCTTYFPAAFTLPWSQDHLKVIAKIERAVKEGGLFAHAMPRGSGKTTLTEIACVWAILCGYRPFVCLIGATADRARAMLESIKTEFECNDELLRDFRRELFPIQALERIHNRANGQLCYGQPTRITWTADKIVMPNVEISKAAGAIITVTGLEGGNIRGQKHKLSDGTVLRPSLVILDDPETTESAWSISQNQRREALVAGDVLGMAGPGKKIAAVLCCTVIRPGDMADNILDRDKHPLWQGERTKLMYSFPTSVKLWDEYARIRAESFRNDGDGHEATEFYASHQVEMDAGAAIAWPQRYNADEISAIQHAMNLRFRDEAAFFAEYQNEPIADLEGDGEMLTAEQVAGKVNGRRRAEIPSACSHLTMFVDVHDKLLFFVVAAWEQDFTGYVVDYGTYPDQKRQFFTLRDARATLPRAAPGTGREGAVLAGIRALLDDYLAREWRRDDGTILQVGRCLIDSGYVPDLVYEAIRQSGRSAVAMPSKGMGIRAANKPFSEYRHQPGDQAGHHWRIPSIRGTRELRGVHIDTNYWKSFIQARLAVAAGDRGCLSLFGRKAIEHRLFAEHIASEYRVKTEGRGRVVEEWKLKSGAMDNHWLDCLVGCAVGASIQGASLPGAEMPRRQRKRYKLSDFQKRPRLCL